MAVTTKQKLLQEIERLVQKQVQPMRTTLTSANYRRITAAALARRLTVDLGGSKANWSGRPPADSAGDIPIPPE